MNVRHPRADRGASPAGVTAGTTTYSVDSDGVIDCPEDVAADVAETLAEVYDTDPDDLVYEEDGPPDESEGDECGYFDPETMDEPCQRAAGWGRDADSGRCKDHREG